MREATDCRHSCHAEAGATQHNNPLTPTNSFLPTLSLFDTSSSIGHSPGSFLFRKNLSDCCTFYTLLEFSFKKFTWRKIFYQVPDGISRTKTMLYLYPGFVTYQNFQEKRTTRKKMQLLNILSWSYDHYFTAMLSHDALQQGWEAWQNALHKAMQALAGSTTLTAFSNLSRLRKNNCIWWWIS